MSEMIERVARALHARTFPEAARDNAAWLQQAWDAAEYDRDRHRKDARAAVQACVEPTDAQLLAGAQKECPAIFKHGLAGLPTDGKTTRDGMARVIAEVRATYRAMVLAALKDPPTPEATEA